MNLTKSYLPSKSYCGKQEKKKTPLKFPIYHNISHWATGEKYNEGKVVVSVSVYYVSRSWFMPIPKDISLDHIQASVFSLLNQPFPHLNKEHQETVSISGKGCAKKKKKTNLSYCIVIPGAEQPKSPMIRTVGGCRSKQKMSSISRKSFF